MATLKPSRFEDYLALRHPEIAQRPGKVNEELLGWIEKQGIYHVMHLQFGFGVVEVLCSSNGLPVYEALTALLDDFDTILATAKQDMLKSPEFDEAARASIMIDIIPRDFEIAPEDQLYSIGIQWDLGYFRKRRNDLGEYVCVYCAFANGRMSYSEWGTIT